MGPILNLIVSATLAFSFGSDGSDPELPHQTKERSGESIYKATHDSVFTIQTDKGTGTGFLFEDPSTVITCYHVVKDCSSIKVLGSKSAVWGVRALKVAPDVDLAILTLDRPSSRTPLKRANANIAIGSKIYAIGTTLGILANSFSEGIVAGLRKEKEVPLVQFTASVSEGNSGGPILNQRGEVVGVVSFSFTEGQSVNMAIAVDALKSASRSPSTVPAHRAPKAPWELEDEILLPLADDFAGLVDATQRIGFQIERKSISLPQKQEELQRYTRFIDGFLANQDLLRIAREAGLVDLRDVVESYRSALSIYLEREIKIASMEEEVRTSGNDDRIRQLSDNMLQLRVESIEKYSSLSKAQSPIIGLSFKKGVMDKLNPMSYYLLRIGPLYAAKGCKIENALVPDPNLLRECSLGSDVLGEHGVQDAREWERTPNLGGAPRRTHAEAVRKFAVAEEGWTIYAVSIDGREWIDVHNWRDITEFAVKIFGSYRESNTPPMKIRVGTDRDSATVIDVWFLSPLKSEEKL